MILRKWEDIPEWMQCPEVREYYDILSKKKLSLALKRVFDVVAGLGVLVITAIPMAVIAVLIKLDSDRYPTCAAIFLMGRFVFFSRYRARSIRINTIYSWGEWCNSA